MKKILLFFIIISYSFAISKIDVYNAYHKKNYKKACFEGAKIYFNFKKDNDFLTIFADSCLKTDNINRMAFPAMLLVRNSSDRSNAIYFLTILYQKKLLYKSLIDGFDVSGFKFPTTNYILSKIFVKYSKKEYIKKNNIYIFTDDKNPNIKYKMKLIKDKNIYKILINTYKNNILTKTRIYW